MSDLAKYIVDEIYKPWKENRQALEVKWNNNIDGFRSISNGIWKKGEGEDWRSDVFIDFTRQKCMAGYALIIDMLLKGGKIPFMLKNSPWGNVVEDEMSEEEQEMLNTSIEAMQDLIHQQNQDCHADREYMKAVLSNAVYGECYLKEIVHEVDREYYLRDEQGGYGELTVDKALSPGVVFVSVWDIIRDLENDDPQEGAGVFHRQMVSPYWLRLQMEAGEDSLYIPEAIEKVLSELTSQNNDATDDNSLPPALRSLPHRTNELEYLEFWGRVPRRIVEEFEETGTDDLNSSLTDIENDGDEVEIMACVVKDTVVRYSINDDKRPFHRAIWEMTIDEVGASGIADNVEKVQLIINGIVRAIDDNTRISGNSMLAVQERFIDSSQLKFHPGARIPIADQCDDVRKAIMPVVIPDVTGSLYNYAEFIEKLLDETSGIPKISQGQVPTTDTGTATEINELVSKSGKNMGAVVRNLDEGLIEPHIKSFYHYNMMDPDCPCKGNFTVEALGFTSYQNQVERLQKMQQLFNIIMSNEQLMQITKFRGFLEEMAKIMDVDIDQFVKTEDEIAEEQSQPNPLEELQKADLEATIQERQANIQATHAGIMLDQGQLELDRMRVENDVVKNATALATGSRNRDTGQGPYRERGMKSNNRKKPVKSVKSDAAG